MGDDAGSKPAVSIAATLKAVTKTNEGPDPVLASLFTSKPFVPVPLSESKGDKKDNKKPKGKGTGKQEPTQTEDGEGRKRKRKREKESDKKDTNQSKKSKQENDEHGNDKKVKEAGAGEESTKKGKKRKKDDEESEDEQIVRKTLKDEEAELRQERAEALRASKRKKEGDLAAKKKRMEKKETPEEIKAKLARTIFVGNVPSGIKKEKLKKTFKEFGKVESVRKRSMAFKSQILSKKVSSIKEDYNDRRKTCNAYIVFATKEEAEKALAANNRVIDDFHIRVDLATGERKLDNSRSVFVGNLSFEAEEEDVRKHFDQAGEVEAVRLIRDAETNYGKGFGYVMYKDRTALTDALRLNGVDFAGRALRVSRAKTNPVATGRKLGPPAAAAGAAKPPQAQKFQGVYSQKGIVPQISTRKSRGAKRAAAVKKGPKGKKKATNK